MFRIKLSSLLKATLLVGTLDILAAFLQFYIQTGKNPAIVLQYISSALVGTTAYNGDKWYIALGLICHYIIVLCYTSIFFALAARFKGLLEYKISAALLYAIFMWAFIQFLVLPFTYINAVPLDYKNVLLNIAILFFCISLPLAYLAPKSVK